MGAVAQYLTYSSQESKFVSSNPATLNACCWRFVIQISNTVEGVDGVPLYCSEQPVCCSLLK